MLSRFSRVFSSIPGQLRALPLARRIVLLTTILIVAIYCGDALVLANYYRALADRVRESRDAKAELLAEHAGRALAAVDLSLQTIADDLKRRLPLTRPTILTQLALDRYARGLPQVRALFVVGQDGRVLNYSKRFPPPTISVADRMYFSEQKKWRGVGLYVDRVEQSRIDKSLFFAMSRPLLDDDGNFEGVIAADIDPRYFTAFYTPRGQDFYDIAVLERKDGAVLAGTGLPARQLVSDDASVWTGRTAAQMSARDVRGFPAKILVIGNAVTASPQFLSFAAVNGGLLLVMTFIAWWLASAAAREAVRVGREAQARQTAEARLLRAIENAPAGFALYDRAERLVLSNEMYRAVFKRVGDRIVPGVSLGELIEFAVVRNLYAGVPDGEERQFAQRRIDYLRSGGEETTFKTEDGRWILTRQRRTQEGDLVFFFSDITRLKQQEEALRRSEEAEKQARQRAEDADRAKTSFLATMSHELRTPLNAIIGFSEMIEQKLRGPLPSTYQQYAEIIRSSGQHLLAIINDILDIAKLNSGKTELHLEPVDVDLLVTEALSIVSKKAESAGIRLAVTAGAHGTTIQADTVRLRQVLINLLSNAVKFTPEGGRVEIATRIEGGQLCVEVKDTGVGMAPEDIPRALEPFIQVRGDQQITHEGTGLGLPISKRLVELHGGRFEIDSAPNAGTAVRIRLPLPATDPSFAPLAAGGAGS